MNRFSDSSDMLQPEKPEVAGELEPNVFVLDVISPDEPLDMYEDDSIGPAYTPSC